MESAQDAQVRLSFDIYNSNIPRISTAAPDIDIDPRTVLQSRLSELLNRVSILVADGALDYPQLLNFIEVHERAAHSHRHPNSMSSQSSGARGSFDSGFTSNHSSRATSTAFLHDSIYSDTVSPTAVLSDTPTSGASDATPVQLAGLCRCHICSRETDPNPSTARYPSIKREHDTHVQQWLYRDWCTKGIQSIMKDCALSPVVRPEDLLNALLHAFDKRWTLLPTYLRLAFEGVLSVNNELQSLVKIHGITSHVSQPVGTAAEAQLNITETKKRDEATRAILHCLHHYLGRSKMIDEPMPKKHRSKTRRPDSIVVARNRQSAQNTAPGLPPLQELHPNVQRLPTIASSSAIPVIGMDENSISSPPTHRNDAHDTPAAGNITHTTDTTDFNAYLSEYFNPNNDFPNPNMEMEVEWEFDATLGTSTLLDPAGQ